MKRKERKERKEMKVMMAAMAVVILLSGCSPFSKITTTPEMFVAPKIEDKNSIFVATFALNPRLDVADSAFLYDRGITSPSFAWKAVVAQKRRDDWKMAQGLAIRVRNGDRICLLIKLPGEFKYEPDDLMFVVDHSGRRLFNAKGEYVMVKDWRKIKVDKYKDFLTKVSEANLTEVKKGTPAWEELESLARKFTAIEIAQVKEYIYQEFGFPLGSPLSAEQLKRIEKEPKVERLKEKLGSNWKVVFTYPLLSPQSYGAYILIAKVFDLSSLWWEENLEQPGYMDRKITAADAFDLIDYYFKNYAR